MALPSRSYSPAAAPDRTGFTAAIPTDRAGGFTIEQLQVMLAPILAGEVDKAAEKRWPLAYSLIPILLVSAGLWIGLFKAISHFL